MRVVLSKDIEYNFIERIEYIDRQVYPEHMWGTYETDNSRFQRNKDSFILLFDNDLIIGYICFFPIYDNFYDMIINSNKMFDDDIDPSFISPEYSSNTSRLFIISIAILEDYRNKESVKLLSESFNKYIEEKNRIETKITEIVAVAVSEGGERFLKRIGFNKFKELEKVLDSNCTLYQRMININE